ncbi:antibiotic biosynthesis monooxygenase [Umezawaea beigongshangensis]|uniref:antibiotic biosynthesis monooxygenase n=1 Tax=Umezawaea beigongshangensis TaxID=2780383 RepID=UPI0018F1ABDD|nr:antibiotic biosynthesis monooxygenase [Umezawaea beigongshangensis]
MIDVTRPGTGFVALVTITVNDPAAHAPLLDLLSREVEQWVRHRPGFVSANYHVSLDGSRIVNYAQWASEEDYRESFRDNPGAGSLRSAITAVEGVEGLEMVGYTLARSIAAS